MPNTKEEICNQALSDLGSRVLIVDFAADTTPVAVQCRLWYDTMRQALLQAAPWGLARRIAPLVQLALLSDIPMPTDMYPWLVKYTYPADCLRVNYILPPPLPPLPDGTPNVSGGPVFSNPWGMPSRANRFIPSYDANNGVPRKVLLSNLLNAYAVYVGDVTDPTFFDASFSKALVAAMSYKLVMPVTGNVTMKSLFAKVAEDEITKARVKDGNEAIPTSDHIPDWIATRGLSPSYANVGGFNLGQWYDGWCDINWAE